MAESARDPTLFWVDPTERGVFPLDGLIVSRSLGKVVRSDRFLVRVDRDFEGVIDGCAAAAPDRRSTWINRRIRSLYGTLFERGHVHTVEVYRGDALVGGLYGVELGAAFFGESMFHRETDASKVALVHLVAELGPEGSGCSTRSSSRPISPASARSRFGGPSTTACCTPPSASRRRSMSGPRTAASPAATRSPPWRPERRVQTEKLVPQPHEAVAFGLLILNDWPIRSSTKSISAPRRKSSETGSITTVAPSRDTTGRRPPARS